MKKFFRTFFTLSFFVVNFPWTMHHCWPKDWPNVIISSCGNFAKKVSQMKFFWVVAFCETNEWQIVHVFVVELIKESEVLGNETNHNYLIEQARTNLLKRKWFGCE